MNIERDCWCSSQTCYQRNNKVVSVCLDNLECLSSIVADYVSGTSEFWNDEKVKYHQEIERYWRPDDTQEIYFKRTGITGVIHMLPPIRGGEVVLVGGEITEDMLNDYKPIREIPIYNIVHYILIDFLFEYDSTPEYGNHMTQLVFEYLGWLYGNVCACDVRKKIV